MAITTFPSPTPEDTEELLLVTRYGELDELKSFIEKFGTKPLTDARDEDGNTVLHMVCGNGHLGATDLFFFFFLFFHPVLGRRDGMKGTFFFFLSFLPFFILFILFLFIPVFIYGLDSPL